MMKWDFSGLRPGDSVWVTGEPRNNRTKLDVDALRELLGDDAAPILAGAWEVVGRCTATGETCRHGATMRVRAGGHEILVHRDDLLRESPEARVERLDREEKQRARRHGRLLHVVPEDSKPAAPEVARCEPSHKPPWADNVRIGAIYLEREPDGGHRVSLLVAPTTGTKWVQDATMRGLSADEVGDVVGLLGRRLVKRASEAQEGEDGRTTG